MNNKTLASVIKDAREKLGISQRELSRKTGIDNNTIAKIEKGLRKKPNVLSLRKLSVALKLEFKDLLKLAEYSKEDIEAATSNSYSSMAIISENAPIMFLDDMVKDIKEELYIKLMINELMENVDVDNLNVLSDLKASEKKKAKKKLEKFLKENNEEIKKQRNAIVHLNNLMNKKD